MPYAHNPVEHELIRAMQEVQQDGATLSTKTATEKAGAWAARQFDPKRIIKFLKDPAAYVETDGFSYISMLKALHEIATNTDTRGGDDNFVFVVHPATRIMAHEKLVAVIVGIASLHPQMRQKLGDVKSLMSLVKGNESGSDAETRATGTQRFRQRNTG